ncbi:hypothetical protein ACX0G9_24455 [Flavitalea flava]
MAARIGIPETGIGLKELPVMLKFVAKLKNLSMGKLVKPFSGSFYEELEMLVLSKKSCEIIFYSENGGRTVIRDKIAGLYADGDKETLKTGSGLIIGLEKLVQVDGMIPSNYC